MLAALFLLVLSSAAPPIGEADSVGLLTVELYGPPAPVELELVAVPIHRSSDPPAEVRQTVTSGEEIGLPLAPGPWVVSAHHEDWWGPPLQVEVEAGSEAVRGMPLQPAGRLAGVLVVPEGETPPSRLKVFFRSGDDRRDDRELPPSSEACTLTADRWSCRLPAGKLDLRLQADGWVPVYRWGVEIAPRRTAAAGTLVLRRGEVVLGWVATPERRPVADARVTLEPWPPGGGSGPDAGRFRRLETRSNEKGFFRIEGVAAGGYRVVARRDRKSSEPYLLRLAPGSFAEIADPPLVLLAPEPVEVVVTPPTAPDGSRWQVALDRVRERAAAIELEPVDRGRVEPTGLWMSEAVVPGAYRLAVGPPTATAWWVETIELPEAGRTIFVDLDLVEVEGRVLLGDEPIPARLTFGGRFGSRRVTVLSSDDGRYRAVLPAPGSWRLAVDVEDPPIERDLTEIEVVPATTGGPARVDIRLPAGRLRGRAVDRLGAGVGEARITVRSVAEGDEALAVSEPDGSFELHGLPAGPAVAEAAAPGDLVGGPKIVLVSDESDPQPVELLLERARWVDLQVLSETGDALPGAQVEVRAAGLPVTGGALGVSDTTGRFRTRLPAAADAVDVTVGAPGYGLRILRMSLPPEGEALGVRLTREGGTLTLEDHDLALASAGEYIVLHGPAWRPLPSLYRWVELNGLAVTDEGKVLVPAVEPGAYAFCRVSTEAAFELQSTGSPGPGVACTEGYLSAGGELTLSLAGGG